jgi:hypothetical protein
MECMNLGTAKKALVPWGIALNHDIVIWI